jgi:hypothetical protein
MFGQNLVTRHFLASLHVCDTIEGLMLALLLGTETHWDMSVFFDKFYGNIINTKYLNRGYLNPSIVSEGL